jgi:hypothetical protein
LRTESPAIPAGFAAGLRFNVKPIRGLRFKMVRKILLNHLLRQLACGITPRPIMLARTPPLHLRKLFEYLPRWFPFTQHMILDSEHQEVPTPGYGHDPY